MVSILKYGTRKDKIHIFLEKLNKSGGKGIDTFKYSGTISLKEDPMQIQKKLRN